VNGISSREEGNYSEHLSKEKQHEEEGREDQEAEIDRVPTARNGEIKKDQHRPQNVP
jgi:hypothetical protein